MTDRRTDFRIVKTKNVRQMAADRPVISVVVPVFNEEESLPVLLRRLSAVLEQIGHYEIIFVDDGSSDNSAHIIRGFQKSNPNISAYFFSRNFGHEAATSCGLHHSTGQTVAIIDSDLQDPPELLLEMFEAWKNGYDVIYAKRKTRKNEPFSVRLTSKLFYRLFRYLSRVNMPLDTGDYRLMDEKVIEVFRKFGERNRYVRGLTYWTGFRQKAVEFNRDPRFAGETKYNFGKRLGLAFDAICGISGVPLRLSVVFGFAATILSLTIAGTSPYKKFSLVFLFLVMPYKPSVSSSWEGFNCLRWES